MNGFTKTVCALLVILPTLGLGPARARGGDPVPADPIKADRAQPWHVTSFVEEARLQGGAVFMIDFEADGIVWVAASDGLYRYDGYRWQRYTTADGLPSNYVRCVRVTRDAELWVGTDRGAGVFDGRTFDPRGSQGNLAGPSVRRIREDPDGTLWFACDHWPPGDVSAGLTRYRDGSWKSWHVADGLPSDYVSDVFRDSSGSHFILTRRGLARFDEDSMERPIEQAGLQECRDYIWSMIETPDGRLVVSTNEWFCVRKDGRWHSLRNDAPRIVLGQFTVTRDGKVIACTSEPQARFTEWKGGRPVPIWGTQLDTRGGVQYIAEAPDGAIWVGGVNVLARWERLGGEWQSFDNLPNPRLRGHDGGVWFANRERVLRLKDDQWTSFPGASVPLIRDSSDGVWMRTKHGLAVSRLDDLTNFTEGTIGVESPRDTRVDAADGVWVIGRGRDGRDCAARYDGRTWTVRPLADIRPTETVVVGTPSADRGMWYVLNDSATELYRLLLVEAARVVEVPLPTAARRYLPPRVRADQSGRLWLFGWMGLYLMELDADSAEWQPIDELPGRQVTEVVELGDDLWISYMGTTGGSGGLSRLHDGAWTHFSIPARRLTSRDGDNTLFFTHPQGVSIVTPDSDGAPRLLTLPEPAWVESMVPDPRGGFWVGSSDRVYHFRPDGIPPETVIDHGEKDIFHGDHPVLQVRGVARFEPSAGSGNFNVAIQLDGEPWGEFHPLADGRVAIGNVATGDHVVRVRVQDQGQDVDPTPAEWRFHLHPVPLQDRVWFQPLAVGIVATVMLLAGISVVARRRELGQRRRKQELEHEILGIGEREQRRIGRDLHDGLGQRLTSISFQCAALRAMLERGDSSGSGHAKEIGAAIGEAILEVKVLAQAVYPAEIERGDLEAALGNLVTSVVKGFDGTCTYRNRWSPAGLSREDALNVYRMVQEALGNAIQHAGAETIGVELRREVGKWVVEVRDDGCGFDPKVPSAGLGQQIMRYRADRIGGRLSVHSRPGVGTTVRCVVPVGES